MPPTKARAIKRAAKRKAKGFKGIQKHFINQSSICRACINPASQLILSNDYTKRSGLADSIISTCSHCHNQTVVQTSKCSGGRGGGFFEINRRSVFTCNAMKGGRESLAKFCSVMGLPSPITDKSYTSHLKVIANNIREVAESNMIEMASNSRQKVLQMQPELEKQDEDGAIPVAVTVDGTWHKRGFSSKYGIVVALLVDTGHVIDFEVLSSCCHERLFHENNDDLSSKAHKAWKISHKDKCQLNYQGSLGGMEGKGAIEILKDPLELGN